MAVNLSAIKDLLLPGLRGIEGKYEQIPAQYDKIFTKHDSKMALERTAEMRFLGYAQLKTEGGQTAFDNIQKSASAMRSLVKLLTTICTRLSSSHRTSA